MTIKISVENAKSEHKRTIDGFEFCPFCGSPQIYAVTEYREYPDIAMAGIFCNSCKATVTWEDIEDDTPKSQKIAKERWNQRRDEYID